jgi:hypothetical protein
MLDNDLNGTQSLVNKYYQEEQQRAIREKSLAEIRVMLPVSDLAMLNMIARRFNKGRDDLSSDVMASALMDIFNRLESTERKLLARDADENARQLANDIAEENGIDEVDSRPGFWANQEKLITKEEKRRARELEKQQRQVTGQAEVDDTEEDGAEVSEVKEAPSSMKEDQPQEL